MWEEIKSFFAYVRQERWEEVCVWTVTQMSGVGGGFHRTFSLSVKQRFAVDTKKELWLHDGIQKCVRGTVEVDIAFGT